MKFLPLIAATLLGAVATPHAHANFDTDKGDLEVQGRIMVDYVYFEDVHNDGKRGSEWDIRRGRIGVKHKSGKHWRAELELNIDQNDNEVSISEGVVEYRGWDHADLKVGRTKEPFGLENLTSSMNISTMERSMVTEAFAPGRNFGVLLEDDSDLHSWGLGIFRAGEDEFGLDGYAATGRLTLSPINESGRLVHLGLSASLRDMQSNDYDVNEPAEVDPARKIIESREIRADSISQFSLEGAFVYRQFSMQAEFMQQYVQELSPPGVKESSVQFSGYYVLASWFLRGGPRPYDGGSFDEPEKGSWELVGRFSNIDLVDQDEGASGDAFVLGINHYVTGRLRLMFNIGRADIEHSSASKSGTGNSMGFRAQYAF